MRLNSIAMAALNALGWEEEAGEVESSSSTSIKFGHGGNDDDDDEVSNMDTDSGHDSDSDFNDGGSNNDDDEAVEEEEDSPFNVAEYSPIKQEEILKTPIISTSNANINKRGDRDCRKSHQSNVNIHIDRGDSNNDNNSGNNNNNNNNNRYPLSHLKPFFDVGTAVYGPWWQGERQIFCDTWYPGKIASYKEYPSSSPYGPRRKYTIHYDDGDKLEDVEDHYVFSKEDYLVLFRKGVGYRCELDTRYAGDLWASLVGYYVVTLDGVDVKFARLVDAMDAYDNHVIQQKGESIRKQDLNRPEKFPELFASSSATTTTTKPPQCASSTRQPRSSPPPEFPSSLSLSSSSSAAAAALNATSPNKLPPGFSSSESDSESQPSHRRTMECNPRHKSSLLSSSSSSVSSTTPKPTSRDRPERTSTESVLPKRRGMPPKCKPSRESNTSLSSSAASPTSSAPAPESTTTPRNHHRKKNKSPPSEVSTASVVTPKTVSVPRKRQKKSLPSKYHGVAYSKIDKKYETQIEYKNIFHSLGLYKFEADAALAYDMGCKLLWNRTVAVAAAAKAAAASPSLHTVAQSDPRSYPTTNFRWKESYEEAIQEEMTNANRKRINVESSYHKVSKSVEALVSKIFFAEEEKLRSLLDNDKSDDNDVNASAQFDFGISTPPPIVATETSDDDNDIETNGTNCRLLRDEENSAPTSQRKRKSGSDDEALADTSDNQVDIDTGAEFEPAISSPPIVARGCIVDNNVIETNGSSRFLLRGEENSAPSSQRNEKYGNDDEALADTIDDVDLDSSAEFEFNSSEPPTIAMDTTDESIPRRHADNSAPSSQRKEKAGNDDEDFECTNDDDNVDTSEEWESTTSTPPTIARETTSVGSNVSKANGTSRQLFRYEDNNALAKKYARFLHPTTGSAFLDYYQKSIREILTGVPTMNDLHAQNGNEVLGNDTNGQCHDEHEEDEDEDCSLFSDGSGGKLDDDFNCSLFSDGCGGEDSEDDDCSLFSDSSHMTPQGCL
ncbi:hypothetical protein ACHAWU_004790 [Discostella pseudostelligera]|uniref:AP2/ERF domain-containing protein n=1 Tax=Discostella pseudostelligera TaxID=259834 RepID=A0ABD3N5Q5_9STRA